MKEILGQFKVFSNIQVGALLECTDLELNGYNKLFSVFEKDKWYIKLRHWKNGNTIVIRWCPDEYTISKNGIKVKSDGIKL